MFGWRPNYLNKAKLLEYAEQNLGDVRLLDEWVPRVDSTGRRSFTRAFAPRLIHVLPGNSPGVAVKSIAHGAMVKAVNLFKMWLERSLHDGRHPAHHG